MGLKPKSCTSCMASCNNTNTVDLSNPQEMERGTHISLSNRSMINTEIWGPSDQEFEEKELMNASNQIFSNGATYSGQLKHKTFEGKKIFIQHGKGIQLWKDGAKYEGDWRNGRAYGSGTFFHANGDKYSGLF